MSLQTDIAANAAELTSISVQVGLLESEVNALKATVVAQLAEIELLHLQLEECCDEEPPPDPGPDPEPPPAADITFDPSNPYTPAKVTAAPAGTTFLFKGPMTLTKATIPTEAGNVYLATGGVVLDGQNSTALAFADSKATGITVDGFEIKGYTGLNGAGEANKEGSAAIILRDGWVLKNANVHDNKYSGVRFEGKNHHVFDSHLHHNHAEGFCGTSKGGGSIERCNIHHNGDAVGTTGLGNNRGGCKMVHSVGFLYADNHVHHNHWNGLWSDINNLDMKYLRNVIEFNEGSGIFHEVSFAAEIAFNTLRDNGINRKISPNDVYPTKAQIEVSNSPDVKVHDNIIEISAGPLGFFGITVLNSNHDQWRLGKMTHGCLGVRNLLVENNTIKLSGPEWVGAVNVTGTIPTDVSGDQKCGQKPITDPASKNVIRNNPTTKSGGAYPAVPYILSGKHVSEAEWAAKGYS